MPVCALLTIQRTRLVGADPCVRPVGESVLPGSQRRGGAQPYGGAAYVGAGPCVRPVGESVLPGSRHPQPGGHIGPPLPNRSPNAAASCHHPQPPTPNPQPPTPVAR